MQLLTSRSPPFFTFARTKARLWNFSRAPDGERSRLLIALRCDLWLARGLMRVYYRHRLNSKSQITIFSDLLKSSRPIASALIAASPKSQMPTDFHGAYDSRSTEQRSGPRCRRPKEAGKGREGSVRWERRLAFKSGILLSWGKEGKRTGRRWSCERRLWARNFKYCWCYFSSLLALLFNEKSFSPQPAIIRHYCADLEAREP